jgi:hypothetical protein
MRRLWLGAVVVLVGAFPISGVDAVPIDAAVKKCLEKSVGKSATRSIERAKKLSAKQQRSVDACKKATAPTTAAPTLPVGSEPIYDLDPALTAEDVSKIKEWTTLSISGHQKVFGVQVSAFTTNVSRDAAWIANRDCRRHSFWTTCVPDRTELFKTNWAMAGCGPSPVELECYHVANLANFRGEDFQLLKTFVHEVHHVVQYQTHKDFVAGRAPSNTVRGTGPDWLVEGLSEWSAYFVVSDLGRTTMDAARADWRPWAARIQKPLSGFEAVDGRESFVNLYTLYATAVDELMKLNGNTPKSITSYYQILGERTPWPTAFQRAFGMTVQDFYTHFERVRPRS